MFTDPFFDAEPPAKAFDVVRPPVRSRNVAHATPVATTTAADATTATTRATTAPRPSALPRATLLRRRPAARDNPQWRTLVEDAGPPGLGWSPIRPAV